MTEDKTICMCECHIKGHDIIHIQACCSLTYQKYLNEDKKIDMEAHKECVKDYNDCMEHF